LPQPHPLSLHDALPILGAPVFVPEGAAIDPTFGVFDAGERSPGAGGVFGGGHEDAEVGVAEEDPEEVVVEADGGGPDAVAVVGGDRKSTRLNSSHRTIS